MQLQDWNSTTEWHWLDHQFTTVSGSLNLFDGEILKRKRLHVPVFSATIHCIQNRKDIPWAIYKTANEKQDYLG